MPSRSQLIAATTHPFALRYLIIGMTESLMPV
jgi:hypothetical protein